MQQEWWSADHKELLRPLPLQLPHNFKATAAQFQGRAHAAACETHGAMCCDDSELCLKRFVNVNVSFGGQFGAHIHCKCVHASSHRDTSPLSSGFTPVPFLRTGSAMRMDVDAVGTLGSTISC